MTVARRETRAPVLVLGIGNELFTDEGLGIVAAEQLAALQLPGVEVLDGGTLGLDLLPEIADRQSVLVLDAMAARGHLPGDVLVLHGAEVPAARDLLLSAHQIGVAEALATAELAGVAPARIAAAGMVPADLATGVGLSSTTSAALGTLVTAARGVLRAWGVPGA